MTAVQPPVLTTRELRVGYAGKEVAAIPDVGLSGGVIWHVIGPNGSGKTALLKTLAGLLPPISGRVDHRPAMGPHGAIYVHPVPYMFGGSVRHNLALTRPPRDHVHAIAHAFGLSSFLERDATLLSHGEQRRLALARALAGRPALLLVDEPEGGLDDDALSAWRACAVRVVDAGEPALVIAAHRPLAFEGIPVRQVRL